MGFYNFFASYAWIFSFSILGIILSLKGRGRTAASLSVLSIGVLGLQIYSAHRVSEDRKTPHYEKGNCYSFPSTLSNRIHLAMVTEIKDGYYTYAIYLEADPRFGEPDAYFVIDSRHPDMYPFNFFETTYPSKVDCPNVATKVI